MVGITQEVLEKMRTAVVLMVPDSIQDLLRYSPEIMSHYPHGPFGMMAAVGAELLRTALPDIVEKCGKDKVTGADIRPTGHFRQTVIYPEAVLEGACRIMMVGVAVTGGEGAAVNGSDEVFNALHLCGTQKGIISLKVGVRPCRYLVGKQGGGVALPQDDFGKILAHDIGLLIIVRSVIRVIRMNAV